MTSFLLVTPDPNLEAYFGKLVIGAGFKYRHVASLKHATDWLKMGSFSAVFIDQIFSRNEAVPFFMDCWKSEIPVALTSKEYLREENVYIKSIGVRDCCGEAFLKAYIAATPKETSIINTHHQKVLVVEDLDSPRQIIGALIESLGYPIVELANSVVTALNVLKQDPLGYFCVVTDLHMPNNSGFVLIKELREALSLSYLPVIVLTSDPSDENLLAALKLGITGFLAKPPKKNLLHAELEKAKRIAVNGYSPEIGKASEIRILEKAIRERQSN